MTHPALTSDSVAVITGGAAGIGLAMGKAFAKFGVKIVLADLGADRLAKARGEITAISPKASVLALETDVSKLEDLQRLEAMVTDKFGGTDILVNNAGIQPGSGILSGDNWARILSVNLWGVIHGVQTFVPKMIARGRPGFIVNTGSKQGITTPPGDPAYNTSKAGVKVVTEALQHQLRNTPDCRLSAHLLIPGFVFTELAAQGRTEKPAGAWTADQTVAFMMERLSAGDFYILCPDNDVPRTLDERRILWAAGDIVENRPPLSRWHTDYGAAFAEFAKAK